MCSETAHMFRPRICLPSTTSTSAMSTSAMNIFLCYSVEGKRMGVVVGKFCANLVFIVESGSCEITRDSFK